MEMAIRFTELPGPAGVFYAFGHPPACRGSTNECSGWGGNFGRLTTPDSQAPDSTISRIVSCVSFRCSY